MDIRNPDLTKKVLSALNPNEILSEDQFEKQRAIINKMKPFSKRFQDEEKTKALEQGKASIEKALEEKGVDISKLEKQPKKGLFDRFKSTLKGPSIKRSQETRRLNISEKQPKKGLFDRFKSTPKTPSINTRTNTQKQLGVSQQNVEAFKQKRRKPIVKPKKNISFNNVFPQQSTTNPMVVG